MPAGARLDKRWLCENPERREGPRGEEEVTDVQPETTYLARGRGKICHGAFARTNPKSLRQFTEEIVMSEDRVAGSVRTLVGGG
jgi:hypothetical protein